MCYEPLGLWVVELTNEDKVKTVTLDADTKITNICLSHELTSDGDLRQSSIKLASDCGHAGIIYTLNPGKIEQAMTNILLPKGAKVSLELVGSNAAFISGYRMRTVCARPGNTKSGSDPTALPVNQASYTGSTLASTTFTNIPLNARQPEPLTYSPSAWPMVPTIVRADCAPVRPIPARVKAVSSSSGSADSVNSSLTTSLVNPPSNHTRSVTIPPPPSQRGGHADGLPDLINPTPNGPASSENSLNKTSQTPKSSDGSINSNTIDPALEYSCMDMKIGTGMPVSEDARLMLQTVFRISSGPLLECYSLPKASYNFRDCHRLAPGLVEGLSGMRGGGVRRIKFRSDAMHSSWIRAEMQEKLAKSSNLSLEIRLSRVDVGDAAITNTTS